MSLSVDQGRKRVAQVGDWAPRSPLPGVATGSALPNSPATPNGGRRGVAQTNGQRALVPRPFPKIAVFAETAQVLKDGLPAFCDGNDVIDV